MTFTEGLSTETQIDSAPVLAHLHDDETWDAEAAAPGGAPNPPNSPRKRGRARAAAPAPLTKGNAPGRTVLVPATRYPRDTCREHGGRGWEAHILSATGVTALVRYLYARTAGGRPYEDTREPLDQLEPLD